ncbi:MAG TPA: hypothetical protein VF933_38060, partial [Streptosporangiaceae bacterium]|nr:hypothetical protein [Gemmataceae bacterium]
MMSRHQRPTVRPTLEFLESRLCLSADLLPTTSGVPDNSHGTHVAGTIGAVGNTGVAIAVSPTDLAGEAPDTHDVPPTDQFTLNFPKIEFKITNSQNDPTAAQVDFFLKLKGIDIEATDDRASSATGTNFF